MTCILLPGMDGTGDLLSSFRAALPKTDFALIVRYPRAQILQINEYQELIDESLPVTEDYILVAESFSGAFAIQIAARNPPPKRLRGIVLCATFSEPPMRGLANLGLRLAAGMFMRITPPASLIRRTMVEPNASEETVQQVRSAIASVQPRLLAHRLRLVLERNVSNLLPAIKVPTLILAAKNDRLVPKRITERFSSGIPNAKIVWIDGPHLLLLTKPSESAAEIQNFLRGL